MHPSGNDVRFAIAVEITERERQNVRRSAGNVVQDELHGAIILKPCKTLRRGILPQIECAYGEDIMVSVMIDIQRAGTESTSEIHYAMEFEFEVSLVFQPVDTMPWSWPWRNVIECISVRVEYVDPSVLIEIGKCNAA